MPGSPAKVAWQPSATVYQRCAAMQPPAALTGSTAATERARATPASHSAPPVGWHASTRRVARQCDASPALP